MELTDRLYCTEKRKNRITLIYMEFFPAIRPSPIMGLVQAISDCHHLITTVEKNRSEDKYKNTW